ARRVRVQPKKKSKKYKQICGLSLSLLPLPSFSTLLILLVLFDVLFTPHPSVDLSFAFGWILFESVLLPWPCLICWLDNATSL
ncbi:MAG: hypothetical protein BYD32DRAFT_487958, partial [Podila humilis]